MIIYKYSLKKDIKNALWTIGDRAWFRKHPAIVVFWPNIFRWFWLLSWILFAKKPKADYFSQDIVCYWVSSGTWGSYHPEENAISICPWKIKESPDKNIEGVISHEITHLLHPEADVMNHEDKERYIEEVTLKEFPQN